MANDDIFRRQITQPLSQGEKGQSDRIRKLSSDPDEILQYRQSLRQTRDKMQAARQESESISQEKAEYIHAPDRPHAVTKKRRRYDQLVVRHEGISWFSSLSGFFAIAKNFRKKYTKPIKVRVSLFNLITQGSLLYPDQSVNYFVDRDLIPLIKNIAPLLRKVYLWGWCDSRGKRIVEPFEFNLVSELERLSNVRYLENYLLFSSSAKKSLETLNPFIGYYLSIYSSPRNIDLLNHVLNKMITVMVASDEANFNNSEGKSLKRYIDDFKNMPVMNNLILPVLESYVGQPLEIDDAFQIIQLEPLSQEEYNADHALKAYMKNKEEKYASYLNAKSKKYEQDLALIQVARNSLERRVDYNNMPVLLIDFGVNHKLSQLPNYSGNPDIAPHQRAYLCVVFFLDVFAPILLSELIVKESIASNQSEAALIFENNVFGYLIGNLEAAQKQMVSIAKKNHNIDLFTMGSENITDERKLHLVVLNNTADIFFNIAIALFHYFQNTQVKKDKQPISLEESKSLMSYYDQYLIYRLLRKKNFSLAFYLFQKKVRDILMDIEAFCFQYCYYYEHVYRSFSNQAMRNKTIKAMLDSERRMISELKKLQQGEDV